MSHATVEGGAERSAMRELSGVVPSRVDVSMSARWRSMFVVLMALAGLLTVLLRLASAQSLPIHPDESPAPQAGIRIVAEDEHHVLLEIALDGYALQHETVDGTVYTSFSLPGWGQSEQPGHPQLPLRRVLLGVPADATLSLSVQEAVPGQQIGPLRPRPAPEFVALPDVEHGLPDPWQPPRIETRLTESPDIYGQEGTYPGEVARLAEVGYMRDLRVAALEISPFQYEPLSQRVMYYPHFFVRLTFSYPAGQNAAAQGLVPEHRRAGDFSFARIANSATAEPWRHTPENTSASPGWVPKPGALKIRLEQDGIYKISRETLAQAGADVDNLDPRTIQVYSGGEEVAVRVHGEADGSFDPADYVLFFGEGIQEKYTDQNVYWLEYGTQQGVRMTSRSADPPAELEPASTFAAEVLAEENIVYSSLWPGDDSYDRWFRNAIALPEAPADLEMELDLGNVSSDVVSSTLWVTMKGNNEWPGSSPDHHVEFFVNDAWIGEHSWDGLSVVQTVSFDFDQSLLRPGLNRVRAAFYGLSGYSVVLVDQFRLRYSHAFQAVDDQLTFTRITTGTWEGEVTGFSQPSIEAYDISEPASVVRLTGLEVDPLVGSYVARFRDSITVPTTYEMLVSPRLLLSDSVRMDIPSDLHDSLNAADYIIISHGDFLPAANELAAYRAGQGQRTMVVDLEDVYDEFGYGLATPAAIRGFLRYAYYNWQPPAPLYVVLLGDGTYDPKGYLDHGANNYVPPRLSYIDPWMGEAATDNWYAAVVGEDIWPDLYLGRMPANSLAEAQTMVRKTIAYEQLMLGEAWNGDLTFVAGLQPDPKGAGRFHDLSDSLISDTVPALYDVARIYQGTIPGATCATPLECRSLLVDRINAGSLLVTYIGHGSVVQWADILRLETLAELGNSDRFPVMLPMTCLEGNFTLPYPDRPAISESLVRAVDKGAVASWGPTGLGVANGHDELSRGFLNALLLEGSQELGAVADAGKQRLYQAGHSLEQIQEYTIFGDPALRLNTPADLQLGMSVAAPEVVQPGDSLTFTLAFSNTGSGIARRPVLTDILPSLLVSPSVVYSDIQVISRHADIAFAWTLRDLLPHSGGELRIRAMVAPTATSPIAFFNRAEIASATYDPAPWNNSVTLGISTSSVHLPLIMRGTIAP